MTHSPEPERKHQPLTISRNGAFCWCGQEHEGTFDMPNEEPNTFLDYPKDGKPLGRNAYVTFVLDDGKTISVSTDGKIVRVSSDGGRNGALIAQGQSTNVIVVKSGDYL